MRLSVVIPVFNEEPGIAALLNALHAALDHSDYEYEIVFVNDGSTDGTLEVLGECAARDSAIKIISFGRNFGHQAAITAGLDFASGDAVVVMDADLQDPPELIPEMVRLYEDGYDVVSPQRTSRKSDPFLKRFTAAAFYLLMRKFVHPRLQREVGDFRLFSASAVGAIRSLRERHRFMRGMIASLGLKEIVLPFERGERAAGETKYPFRKMLWFSWTAITSFSGLPLRLTLGFGLVLVAFSIVYLVFALYAALFRHETVPGWTSLVLLQCLFSGSIMIAVGLLGDYVARIYDETKARPLYVVDALRNIRPPERGIPGAIVIQHDVIGAPVIHAGRGPRIR
jgi:polyisoprenyl-phosphate glycosyltransferase